MEQGELKNRPANVVAIGVPSVVSDHFKILGGF